MHKTTRCEHQVLARRMREERAEEMEETRARDLGSEAFEAMPLAAPPGVHAPCAIFANAARPEPLDARMPWSCG